MKKRLTINVESGLVEQAKLYAAKNNCTLAELVEQYFKSLLPIDKKMNAIEYLRSLPKPKQSQIVDLKTIYFEKEKNKYGF